MKTAPNHVPRRLIATTAIALLLVAAPGCETESPAGPSDAATTDTVDKDTGATPGMPIRDLALCSAPTEAIPPVTGDDYPDSPKGEVQGRVIDPNGNPVEGVKVLACTEKTCITVDSAADGSYDAVELPWAPHKVQILGEGKGYMNFNFYQDPTAVNPHVAPWDIVAYPRPSEPQTWGVDAGGTVSLAGGKLELTAPAGALEFPLGYMDFETKTGDVAAVEVAAEDLAPFDVDPTICATETDPVYSFVVNPLPMKVTSGSFEMRAKVGANPGVQYGVWVVDDHHGSLHKVATATADAQGDIVLDDGAELTLVSQIVLAPEAQ